MTQVEPLVRPVDPNQPKVFAQCRSLGHEWRHRGTAGADVRRPFNMHQAVGLRSQCTDCKTERIKWITRSGEVITRYSYPEGYNTHGDERRTSQQWRSQFVTYLFSEG